MPKSIKILFFSILTITVIILGMYLYVMKSKDLERDIDKDASSEITLEKNSLYREYTEGDVDKIIQAIYIRTSEGKLYYRDRGEIGSIEKSISLSDSFLFVCMPPTQSLEIKLEEENTGYRDIINAEQLNTSLFQNDPIAIAIINNEDGTEGVKYIVVAKCDNVE